MLKEILTIGNYPYLKLSSDRGFTDKLGRVFKTYGFVVLALVFIAAPIIASTDFFVVHVLHFKGIDRQGKANLHSLLHKHYYFNLVYICLLGPILEETVFRLPLSFKKTHIALSIACAALLFVVLSVKPVFLIGECGILCTFIIELSLVVILFFITKWLLPNDIQPSDRSQKWLIILSIFLFGFMHISNFSPIQWPIIWIYPLYVVPQLFMGWFITYVRFKNGFIWGIVLHCLINSLAMVLTISNMPAENVKQVYHITAKAKSNPDTSKKVKLKTK